MFDERDLSDPKQGLLEALLLGYRGNIDSATYQAFEKTGLLHLISLSGLHLGILAGGVWWICARIGLLKKGKAVACIIFLVLFLMVVPARAPTIRAAIICFVFCLAVLLRRHKNPINTLSLAAIILLLIRPTQLFEVGWQLSFVSVLSILLLCPRSYSFLTEKLVPKTSQNDKRGVYKLIFSLESLILAIFSTGFTAWIGGAGILLYHFNDITFLTSLWTVFVFPLVVLILSLGFLKIILSVLFTGFASVLTGPINILAMALIWLVKAIGKGDFSNVAIGYVPFLLIIFYYTTVTIATWPFTSRIFIRKAIAIGAISILVFVIGFIKWSNTHPDGLVMTCLDVGHGQAVVIQTSEKVLIFDAGSQYNKDIGSRIVNPFLRYKGINKIDAVFLSHDDIDHINGLPEVAANYEIDHVYVNSAFLEKSNQRSTAGFLAERLSDYGRELEEVPGNYDLGQSGSVKIIWPSEKACGRDDLSDNDKSLVALIEYAEKRILLCGDIEKYAQEQILKNNPEIKADIVLLPHHGSALTTSSDFVERLAAEYLICSRGKGRGENGDIANPNEKSIFHTSQAGAVKVFLRNDGEVGIAVKRPKW